ncbi:hypothetical protein [Burkholderia diffusa]|uniref:hypothetical protein n=1 Tax=Burkholderia diffusa TaxID=488732 RepID=UPI002ABD846E|nr:hypothetical protein [Burkholderia diffusa]
MKALELNRIKTLLRDLVLSRGLTDAELNSYNVQKDDNEWHINWKGDQGEVFDKRMQSLEGAMDLYESAMAKMGCVDSEIGIDSRWNRSSRTVEFLRWSNV